MSTLILEPMTDLDRKLRAERAQRDDLLVATSTCVTEYGRRTGEEMAGWVRSRIRSLERERLSTLRHPRDEG